MTKYFYVLIFCLLGGVVEAQQLKRQTLGSQGSSKVAAPYRISYTFGSCPGCNTLSPTSPAGAGSLRQGFQQPPNTDASGNPANCTLTANFEHQINSVTTCGTKYDFQYTGNVIQGVVFSWDFGPGGTPRTSNLANPTGITFGITGANTVVLKVTKDNCVQSSAQIINLLSGQPGYTAGIAVANVRCYGANTGSIILTPSGVGASTYLWSNGATTKDLTNVPSGRYQCKLTSANGCTLQIDTLITQPDTAFKLIAVVKKEYCKGTRDGAIVGSVSGGARPYRYAWDNGNTTNHLDSIHSGNYHLVVTDVNNCTLDTTFRLTEYTCQDTTKKSGNLFNTISPNGDGKNDKWIINGIEDYPNLEVIIFNRWGEVVYSKQNYANEWTGTNNKGEELPSGAYYYHVTLNDVNGTVYVGPITIIR
jgi:gliding motility-associated-like protein